MLSLEVSTVEMTTPSKLSTQEFFASDFESIYTPPGSINVQYSC